MQRAKPTTQQGMLCLFANGGLPCVGLGVQITGGLCMMGGRGIITPRATRPHTGKIRTRHGTKAQTRHRHLTRTLAKLGLIG